MKELSITTYSPTGIEIVKLPYNYILNFVGGTACYMSDKLIAQIYSPDHDKLK